MGGYSYLEFIRNLADRINSDWDGIVADLEAIRSAVLSRSKAFVNMTGDGAGPGHLVTLPRGPCSEICVVSRTNPECASGVSGAAPL